MTYIFVVYNFLSGLFLNLERLYTAGEDFKVIVVDNSDNTKSADIQSALKAKYPEITYIRSPINNRITAYNLGFNKTETEWVCFRTDDDIFNEAFIAPLIEQFPGADVISGCHSYDNQQLECTGPNRPLESFIFRTKTLAKYFPMKLEDASDWAMLGTLYDDEQVKISHFNKKILDKKVHGRSL